MNHGSPGSEPAHSESATLRVLVVDDSGPFRSATCAYLAELARVAIVGEAANGHQALLMQQQLGADLVLMDVHMPVMTGLEAVRRMKEQAHTPMIVLLSVRSDEHTRRAALAAGADDFLAKSDFDARLQDVLARARQQRARTAKPGGPHA